MSIDKKCAGNAPEIAGKHDMDVVSMHIMDDTRPPDNEPSKVRKGKFLWMDEAERKAYLDALNRKIASGYFYSEPILTRIVDEIAPVIEETIDNEMAA